MGHEQMLRVNKAEEWLRRAPTRPDLSTHGDCVLIRSAHGAGAACLTSGVTGQSAGARALCLHVVMIPPGSRGMPHFHPGHETAIYSVSGQTEVWHGHGLVKRTVVRAGDFLYIPADTPHLRVNRGDVTAIAVVARTDPEEPGSRVTVELPRHLAGLLSLPVAAQELTGFPAPASRGVGPRFPLV
jgi:uncharacterized RmlC-like cupin family protein